MTNRAALVRGATLLVPDASVAAKWFLDDEDHTAQANEILHRYGEGNISLEAPDSFFYELTGLIRTAERRTPPRITSEGADAIYAAIEALVIQTTSARTLVRPAVHKSRELGIAVYDALYLCVAEGVGRESGSQSRSVIPFVTADRRLYEKIQHLPYVCWLGDL